ncbi:MAG: hypothetical protein DI607_09350 [Sphingomonas hengshuiensis]|nr:MAG: hypothetical protein DI607_09350 [Sphingomonas hengshuiensis]
MDEIETEASRIIRKCGGTTATAKSVGSSPASVSKWNAPRAKGGADGRVPARHALTLLQIGLIDLGDLDGPVHDTEAAE